MAGLAIKSCHFYAQIETWAKAVGNEAILSSQACTARAFLEHFRKMYDLIEHVIFSVGAVLVFSV
jgi:hypothetical protein